ncbi:MAG: hypothetical protein NTZ26_00820 [Candidatus Aminicenantes bacterium]|nr:hypothetical protein [Candidatus Aminicenantes bacterium]
MSEDRTVSSQEESGRSEAFPEPEGVPEVFRDGEPAASPEPPAAPSEEKSPAFGPLPFLPPVPALAQPGGAFEAPPVVLPSDGEANDVFENIGPLQTPARPERPADLRGRSVLEGPVGLDIGTAHIVVAVSRDKQVMASIQRNAFYAIPATPLTRDAFQRDKILYFEKDSKVYVLGHSAEDFAGICRDVSRRPIENGMLNAREDDSETILKAIISRMVRQPKKKGEIICFSVPGEALDRPDSSLAYHETIIKEHLASLGYRPMAVNEGMAVVLSELAGNNFTGLGISLGAGLCNVCFSYMTVPVVSFSVVKGGDFIDTMVARSTGEPIYEVRRIKERELDLAAPPRNKIESGLHVYYDDVFLSLIQGLQRVLGSSDNIPRLPKPVPIVLAGGTIMPPGGLARFQKHMKSARLPFRVSEITQAAQPLFATVKGALMTARLNG